MTTHKINDREYLFETIDEDAKDIYIGVRMYKYKRMFSKFKRTYHAGYKILGIAYQLTEEQAKELVEIEDVFCEDDDPYYKSYQNIYAMCGTAKDSLRSLITSLGLSPERTLIIERKK